MPTGARGAGGGSTSVSRGSPTARGPRTEVCAEGCAERGLRGKGRCVAAGVCQGASTDSRAAACTPRSRSRRRSCGQISPRSRGLRRWTTPRARKQRRGLVELPGTNACRAAPAGSRRGDCRRSAHALGQADLLLRPAHAACPCGLPTTPRTRDLHHRKHASHTRPASATCPARLAHAIFSLPTRHSPGPARRRPTRPRRTHRRPPRRARTPRTASARRARRAAAAQCRRAAHAPPAARRRSCARGSARARRSGCTAAPAAAAAPRRRRPAAWAACAAAATAAQGSDSARQRYRVW